MTTHSTTNQAAGSGSDPAFHPFPALPYELRTKIWMEHLKEATPLVYRFSMRYSRRSCVKSGLVWHSEIYHYAAKPEDRVILKPTAYDDIRSDFLRQNLILSTSASRAALATCIESRQIALKILPDSLPFRNLPRFWTANGCHKDDPADGTAYPEYILRFNGARDIIIFDAGWEDQEAVVEISKLQGRVPDGCSRMQHVGISVGALEFGHGWDGLGVPSYGVNPDECRCVTDDCRDTCRLEPLPRFLSCFPLLKTFYIARVSCSDPGDTSNSVRTYLKDASCQCNLEENGVGGSGVRHVWSTIKSADIDRWCVAWDERTGCFPTNYLIEEIRQFWRAQFPYYKELKHLDIKFLRRLDPGGKDCYWQRCTI